MPDSIRERDSHDSEDIEESPKSTLGKRKAEAEFSEDDGDEFITGDLVESDHKKRKLVSSSDCITSQSDSHEDKYSEEMEEVIPTPTRNNELEWCYVSICV